MTRRLRVAIIGFGAIGLRVAQSLAEHADRAEVVGVLVRDPRPHAVRSPQWVPLLTDRLDTLLSCAPDLVVECAGHAAIEAYGETVLHSGHDLLIASAGALADDPLRDRLRAAAATGSRRVSIITGAIGGLDWLRAAGRASPLEVTYRGRKAPAAWRGSAAEDLLDLDALTTATAFFRGSAREAARRFPKNANVTATVALATAGLDATRVELWADPAVTENVHEVHARGACGLLAITLRNSPDPDNPRTSAITAYSVLDQILNPNAGLTLADALASK